MGRSISSARAAWVLAGAGLLISASPILVKAVDRSVLGPTAIGVYRVLFAVGPLMLLARMRRERLRLSRRVALLVVLAALCFAADLFVWHRAIHAVGAGLSTILGNTQVVWVSLVGVFVLGERGGWRLIVSVTLAIVGVTLLSGVLAPDGMPRIELGGLGLGVLTGVLYAAYLLVLRGARMGPDAAGPLALMAWVSAVSTVFLLALAALAGEQIAFSDARTLWLLLGLALLVQTFGWWAIALSIARVPVALAGLLLLLQPLLSTVWGALVFGETLTVFEGLGAGLVLLAIYLGSIRRGRVRVEAAELRDAPSGGPA